MSLHNSCTGNKPVITGQWRSGLGGRDAPGCQVGVWGFASPLLPLFIMQTRIASLLEVGLHFKGAQLPLLPTVARGSRTPNPNSTPQPPLCAARKLRHGTGGHPCTPLGNQPVSPLRHSPTKLPTTSRWVCRAQGGGIAAALPQFPHLPPRGETGRRGRGHPPGHPVQQPRPSLAGA